MGLEVKQPGRGGTVVFGFVCSLLSLPLSLYLFVVLLALSAHAINPYMVGDEACCLSLLSVYALTLPCSVMGVVLSSMSVYRIRSHQTQRTWMARAGLVLGIISAALFLLSQPLIFMSVYRF